MISERTKQEFLKIFEMTQDKGSAPNAEATAIRDAFLHGREWTTWTNPFTNEERVDPIDPQRITNAIDGMLNTPAWGWWDGEEIKSLGIG